MAKTKVEYDILISCPGDVIAEIKIIEKVIKKFNDTFSDSSLIRLNAKHWSKNSYNQSGGSPQDLLNKQFVHDCDAAIAIFWTRFGTPTDKYGSGTEEEIEDMIQAGKQVFMYFSSAPISPELLQSEDTRKQYEKIKDFKNKYKDNGIYSSFSKRPEFEKNLFAHISQHFLSVKKIEEISLQKKSNLILKGIVNDSTIDEIVLYDFSLKKYHSSEKMMAEIKKLYQQISEYAIAKSGAMPQLHSVLHYKVEVSTNQKDSIIDFAEFISFFLPSDFFNLGELFESGLSFALYGGKRDFEGSEDETNKYINIIQLYEKIKNISAWMPFENGFTGLKYIKLAVCNDGKTYDEDIDAELKIPMDAVILPLQLPKIEESAFKFIAENYSLENFFEIEIALGYNNYQSSQKTVSQENRQYYVDHCYKNSNNQFKYDFFEKGNDLIIKLHIDYLKHNTSVAFPTVLFVKDNISDFHYAIKSKHNDIEFQSSLKVGGTK